jgi:hypothetical protein
MKIYTHYIDTLEAEVTPTEFTLIWHSPSMDARMQF